MTHSSMAGGNQKSRPAHHANDSATSFVNPWPSADSRTWLELCKSSLPFGRYPSNLHLHEHAREIKVVVPDWGTASLQRSGLAKQQSLVGTWLGHATALAEFPALHHQSTGASLRFLFDPIFSVRASPTQASGPARLLPAPCKVADLAGCDAVFVSHNHYDHLDLASVIDLLTFFPKAKYFVPLGIRSWLVSVGVPENLVFELDWWDSRSLGADDFHSAGASDSPHSSTTFRITCVPAQHNSARSPIDQRRTLWCGWVIERFVDSEPSSESQSTIRNGAIYHAGDTGYRRYAQSSDVCPAFEEIGDRLGPFDLSFIPIWRGGTLGFFSYYGIRLSHHDISSALHTSPADAIDIHLDVRSRNTVAIHFGTFVGSEKETHDAAIEFAHACEERSVVDLNTAVVHRGSGRAGLLDIGESIAIEIEDV